MAARDASARSDSARMSLEDFGSDHQRSLKLEVNTHLVILDLAAVVDIGRPLTSACANCR